MQVMADPTTEQPPLRRRLGVWGWLFALICVGFAVFWVWALFFASKEAVNKIGDRAWAIQFHAEVERHMLDRWFAEGRDELPKPLDEIEAETGRLLGGWNDHGRALCGAFLDEATRLG